MSDEQGVTGLMVQTDAATYFIPEDDLSSYRLPEDLAAVVEEDLGGEVSGFAESTPRHKGATPAIVTPMEWTPTLRPEPQRIMLHTVTRL